MSSTGIGRTAEAAVRSHLAKQGYQIVNQNWRSKWCEIDLIARKHNIIYLIEVKYRRSNRFGDGLQYITAGKQRQMHFAARYWATVNGWEGDMRLLAASVTGEKYESIELVELHTN